MPRGTDRYDEARLQGRLWTPEAARGSLVGWYDAGDFSTIEITSGKLSGWRDKAGRSNLSQATDGNRPGWSAAYSTLDFLKGKPAVYFGVAGATTALAGATSFSSTTLLTVAIASLGDGTASGADSGRLASIYKGTGDDWNTAGSAALIARSALGQSIRCDRDSISAGVKAVTYYRVHLMGSLSNGSTVTVFVDAAAGTSTAVGSTLAPTTLSLGAGKVSGAAPARGWRGFCYEVVLATDITLHDKINGYLSWKWHQSANNLPASHPFKSRPPLIGD